MKLRLLPLACATIISLVGETRAAALASDSAADPAYDSGWADGSNGGSGWGSAWMFTATDVGNHLIGDSSTNGDGDTSPPAGDINTAGRAWGITTTSGTTRANRFFNGALSVGQPFHLNMDNGSVPSNGDVGFSLINAAGNQVWQFSITGSNNYEIFAQGGFMNTGIAATDEGLDISFMLTSATTYSASIGILGSAPTVFNGALLNEATGQDVSGIRLFNINGGATAAQTLYFNSISIVPEPTTIGLVSLGALSLLLPLRRRK